jgi:(heptosyl)LPS beta-1,4-glucosyltransferase
MSKISLVVNVVDEELQYIEDCLNSTKALDAEIVIVDMTTGDELASIAKKYGAKVHKLKRASHVEVARNFGLSKANGEWILILDPDETLPKQLVKRFNDISQSPEADYFAVPRRNIIFGKWIKHSRWFPDYNIRFFRKGFVDWSETIHSVPITHGKGRDLQASKEYAITHNHYSTVEQYITRMNRYTTVQAKEKIKDGYKFNWHDIIRKPTSEFVSRYFAGQGYRDGLHGLAIASLQAFSELVVYVKIWQENKFKEEELSVKKVIHQMKDAQGDVNYWQADTLLKEGAGITQRIKRKFKLT